MAEGIYSSYMSVWERNKKGLKADHAGRETIEGKKALTVEEKVETAEVLVEDKVETEPEGEVVYGIADEEGYLAFDGKTWKTLKGVKAAFEKVDEGVGYFIVEVPVVE